MVIETTTVKKHSGLGLAAFIVSAVTVALIFAVFCVAGYLSVTHSATPALNFIVGMAIFFCWFVDLIALGLGIAGFCDKNSRKLFPILAVAIAIGTVALSVAIILLGLRVAHG